MLNGLAYFSPRLFARDRHRILDPCWTPGFPMARPVRDENIGSRNARLSLIPRRKPYFRAIAQGLHLGYRRNRAGDGSGGAGRYLGGERYETEVIPQADDYRDANSLDVLTFADAQRAAARWHD